MCGRTRLSIPPSDLAEVFHAPLLPPPSNPHERGPRDAFGPDDAVNLNCAPTDPVVVVRRAREGDRREMVPMSWGLVPFYVRDLRDCKPMINARVESVAHSRAFRAAYQKRRCLLLADGFYEWHDKVPQLIQRPGGAPFGLAAVWDRWKGPKGEVLETCAVLTRPPSPDVAAVHDRMPVALESADHDAWLDPATDPHTLREVLSRAVLDWVVTAIGEMPVSSRKLQLATVKRTS